MSDRMYSVSEHYYHAQALVTLAELRMMQQRLGDAGALLLRAKRSLDALQTPSAVAQKYFDRVRTQFCADPLSVDDPACSREPG